LRRGRRGIEILVTATSAARRDGSMAKTTQTETCGLHEKILSPGISRQRSAMLQTSNDESPMRQLQTELATSICSQIKDSEVPRTTRMLKWRRKKRERNESLKINTPCASRMPLGKASLQMFHGMLQVNSANGRIWKLWKAGTFGEGLILLQRAENRIGKSRMILWPLCRKHSHSSSNLSGIGNAGRKRNKRKHRTSVGTRPEIETISDVSAIDHEISVEKTRSTIVTTTHYQMVSGQRESTPIRQDTMRDAGLGLRIGSTGRAIMSHGAIDYLKSAMTSNLMLESPQGGIIISLALRLPMKDAENSRRWLEAFQGHCAHTPQ
jgi:hypothetical protein